MKFEEWWATLTPAEQKVIGRTNAKFVWLEACDAEREACAKVCDELETCSDAEFFGYEFSAAIRARGQA